ncbi:MAG: AraC family transcriptional regulator [Pigmentiphaga sp.]
MAAATVSSDPHPAEPLAGHVLLRSHDLAEVRQKVGEVFCPHALQPVHPRQRLDARHHMVQLGQTGLNYLAYGADVRIEPGELEHFYLVQMPLSGGAEVTCGSQYVVSSPEVASLLNPQDATRMCWGASNRQLLLWIPREALEQRLAEHLGSQPTEALRFEVALPQNHGLTQAWCQMVRDLAHNIDHCGTAWLQFQATVSGFEDALMRGLLQLHRHNYSERLQQPAAAAPPRHVQRAIDYLEAHLEHDVNAADLARAACCSVRALEEGFRRHCQSTPMQYARSLKLDRIHQLLKHQHDVRGLSITLLAHRYGFIHLGRFAAYYKERFGESPSQTLKRRQAH